MSTGQSLERVRLTIEISKDEEAYLKILSEKKGISISELIMYCVRPEIAYHVPNAETLEAMRDVELGRNLTKCNSLEEFWQALDIDPNA